ncbi:MAG: hypothetical protein ACYCX6_04370 [Vulcanimicrobiaceae bacterium]
MDGYQRVYLLSQDGRQIARIQNATLHTDFGFALDHGLFGSDDWWRAIERGELSVNSVRGTICALLMESQNDWPIFRILTEDGVVTGPITREALPQTAELYQVGRRVIWKYVETPLKRPVQELSTTSKVTLEVWVAETVILYRPVGPDELNLIAGSGYSHFPPRLPEQSIFYPVCTQEYAETIASNWNVRDSGCGYVTRFEVDKQYLDRYEVHQVGNNRHREYWIPADELAEFNGHLIGKIQIVKAFRT